MVDFFFLKRTSHVSCFIINIGCKETYMIAPETDKANNLLVLEESAWHTSGSEVSGRISWLVPVIPGKNGISCDQERESEEKLKSNGVIILFLTNPVHL